MRGLLDGCIMLSTMMMGGMSDGGCWSSMASIAEMCLKVLAQVGGDGAYEK